MAQGTRLHLLARPAQETRLAQIALVTTAQGTRLLLRKQQRQCARPKKRQNALVLARGTIEAGRARR